MVWKAYTSPLFRLTKNVYIDILLSYTPKRLSAHILYLISVSCRTSVCLKKCRQHEKSIPHDLDRLAKSFVYCSHFSLLSLCIHYFTDYSVCAIDYLYLVYAFIVCAPDVSSVPTFSESSVRTCGFVQHFC